MILVETFTFYNFSDRKNQYHRILKDFHEYLDFPLKPMILSSNRGRKINFLVKLFFKLFLFLENLQNGFFTFLISAFNQKLHRETYTQFSDFHDF